MLLTARCPQDRHWKRVMPCTRWRLQPAPAIRVPSANSLICARWWMRLPAACADRSPRRASRRSLLIESNEGARAERDTVSAKRGSSWMSFQNYSTTCAHSREVNQSNCDIELQNMIRRIPWWRDWQLLPFFLSAIIVRDNCAIEWWLPSFLHDFTIIIGVLWLAKHSGERECWICYQALRCTIKHRSKEPMRAHTSCRLHITSTNEPRNGPSSAPRNQPNIYDRHSDPLQWKWQEEILHKYYTTTDLWQMYTEKIS